MLLPILLLTLAPAQATRTLHLKHVIPSQLMLQLIDPAARHPLTEPLERLAPDDARKTLTLVGPSEAVKTVEQAVRWLDVKKPQIEVEVELVGAPDHPLKGKVVIAQNERGILTLLSTNVQLQFQLVPHLNQDGTCSLSLIMEQRVIKPAQMPLSTHIHHFRTSSFVRVKLGKSAPLGNPMGLQTQGSSLSLPIQITPRLKK